MEMRFGTWNVKTLNGKEVELVQEMIMEARTEGRRGRGRPRKAYMDKIEDIAMKTGKGIG